MSQVATDSELKRMFECPPDEFFPVPWWEWTGNLDVDLLHNQLLTMHEQGIREFFIFPIYGMEPEYMGEGYLSRISSVLEWCKALGMKAWIYDEYNWPSGTAAGRVPEKHPWAVASPLYLEDYPELSPVEIGDLMADSSVLNIVEILPDGTSAKISEQSLKSKTKRHIQALRRNKDATVTKTIRGCLWAQNNPGILDILSSKAVRAFIDEAYEPVAKAFSKELGSTVKGFFFDEPHFVYKTIPWTDGLRDAFIRRFGYDVVPRLFELIYDVPGCDRLRVDFWSLVSEMGAEAFTGQITQWCEERGMLLTGHLIHEENSYAVGMHGDSPTHHLKMPVPGCDLLELNTNFTEPEHWYSFGAKSLIKTPKQPASAARFSGRSRVMCEAYGVLPWTKTQADEKYLTDWLVALGVNMINDNSLIADISDFRKRGASGKHFTQPYWPYEHMYYTYAGRICTMSAGTVLDTELLILYPSTTWWANTHAGGEVCDELRNLERAFDTAADVLVRKHWDFEFLYEQILEESMVKDGRLVTGHGSFRGITIAGISHLKPEHAARLEEFDAAGGVTFIVGTDVRVMEKGGYRPLKLANAITLKDWRADGFYDEFDAALKERIEQPWAISGSDAANIISSARVDGSGGRHLFIANMTSGDKTLSVKWKPGAKVEFRDADNADCWMPGQSEGSLSFVLPEGQSIWLTQTPDPTRRTEPPAHFMVGDGAAVELGGRWDFSIDRPNIYSLEYKLKPDCDGTLNPLETGVDESWIKTYQGDAGIPLTPESMKYYWIAAEFNLSAPINDLELVVDSTYFEKAYLNGKDQGDSIQSTVWDYQNRAWEIGSKAVAGRNTLLLRVNPSPYNAANVRIFPATITEPVVLRGSFAIDVGGKLTAMPGEIRTGDWGVQGFPHFAGTGIYRNTFTWKGGDALISADCGRDVVEVLVDGASLGMRAWGRRQYLAKNLTAGEHKIEVRITNTLGGILRRPYSGQPISKIPECGLLSPLKIIEVHR